MIHNAQLEFRAMTPARRPSAHSTLPLPSPPTSHQLPVHILTLNGRSLYNKVDELQETLRLLQNPPVVICVTESWCVTYEPDSLYALQQYSLFRRDRPDRPGGGVLVYVHTSQVSEATRMRELETAKEDIWLKITVYNSPTPLLLCATYRPPTSSATACTAFCSHIEHSIRVAKSLKGHILIAGDMNAKCSDWYRADITDACGESLNTVFNTYNLSKLVTFPTHTHAGQLKSCLDLIATDLDDVTLTSLPPLGLSDHVQILASIPSRHFQNTRSTMLAHTKKVWCWSKANNGALKEAIKEVRGSFAILFWLPCAT